MSDVFLILACTAIVSVAGAYVAYILGRDKHAASLRITALDLAITEENRNGPAYLVVDRASAYVEFIDPKPVQEAPASQVQHSDGSITAQFREVS